MTVDPELLTGIGAAMAIFLTAAGSGVASAYGGIHALRSNTYKDFVPIVQAGVLSIYGIIVGVMLAHKISVPGMTAVDGYKNLSAGLSVGFACLASGFAMASFLKQLNEGKAEGAALPAENREGAQRPLIPRANDQKGEPDFRKLVFIMVFLEAIGLYGLIVSLVLMG